MKNWIKNVSVLIVLFASLTIKADDDLSIVVKNASFVNVSVSNVEKGDKLVLKDYSDVILYSLTMETAKEFGKYFDFNNVPDGIYYIEVENKSYVKNTPILKNENGVSLLKGSAITIFKPQVKVTNKEVKVLFVNTELKPVTLNLYDNTGLLLDAMEVSNDQVLHKTYNFDNMPGGDYSLYVGVNGRGFLKNFSIK